MKQDVANIICENGKTCFYFHAILNLFFENAIGCFTSQVLSQFSIFLRTMQLATIPDIIFLQKAVFGYFTKYRLQKLYSGRRVDRVTDFENAVGSLSALWNSLLHYRETSEKSLNLDVLMPAEISTL